MRIRRSLLVTAVLCGVGAAALRADPAADFVAAKLLADDGHVDEAVELLEKTIEAVPDDPFVRLERARLLALKGRLDEAAEAIEAARKLAPGEAEILRQQGRIAMSRLAEDVHAAETAKEAFEALRAAAPEDLEALVALGQLYLEDNQPALASEVLEEAHRLRPDHPWIESLRTSALARSGDRAANEKMQRETLSRRPADLRTRFDLAESLARQGRHGEAAEILAAAPAAQRQDLDLKFRLARQLFWAGDPGSSLTELEAVVAAHPEAAGPRLLLARIDLALGYFDRAEAALAPIADREPNDAGVAELRWRALEGLGRVDEAVEILDRRRSTERENGGAIEADSASLVIARLRAAAGQWQLAADAADEAAASGDAELAAQGVRLALRARVEAGRTEEALARIEDADPTGMLRLEILLRAGRLDDARAWIAAQESPNAERRLEIGGLLQDAERFEEALPWLQEAVRQMPDSREAQFRLATCLERLGRHDESVAAFQGIVSTAPQFAPALNYLGYLWIERAENLEQAVQMVGTAVRLDPDNGAYVDSLGWGYFRLGREVEAVPLLERAARLMPRDATVLEHLGDALAATGETVRAREAYSRALAAGPESTATVERKLARLGGDS